MLVVDDTDDNFLLFIDNQIKVFVHGDLEPVWIFFDGGPIPKFEDLTDVTVTESALNFAACSMVAEFYYFITHK